MLLPISLVSFTLPPTVTLLPTSKKYLNYMNVNVGLVALTEKNKHSPLTPEMKNRIRKLEFSFFLFFVLI